MILFCDRCLGRSLPLALREHDKPIELHDDHYAQDVHDDIWLPEVGQRGWFVLTKDEHFRYNVAERQALIEHAVGCFTIVMRKAPWQQMRDSLLLQWPKIEKVAASETRPFLYMVYSTGPLRRYELGTLQS